MIILLISTLLLVEALADKPRREVEAGQCSSNLRSRTCFGVQYNQSRTECLKGYDQLYCARVALKDKASGEWKVHNAMFATDRVLDKTQCVKKTAEVMEVVCADKNCKDFDKMPLDRIEELCSIESDWRAEPEKKKNKPRLTAPGDNDEENDDDYKVDDKVIESRTDNVKANAAAIKILNEKVQMFEKDLTDIPSKNEMRLIWAGFLVVVAVLMFMIFRDHRKYAREAISFHRNGDLRLIDNVHYEGIPDAVYKPSAIKSVVP